MLCVAFSVGLSCETDIRGDGGKQCGEWCQSAGTHRKQGYPQIPLKQLRAIEPLTCKQVTPVPRPDPAVLLNKYHSRSKHSYQIALKWFVFCLDLVWF